MAASPPGNVRALGPPISRPCAVHALRGHSRRALAPRPCRHAEPVGA